jgi:hypothetical protein
MRCDGVVDGRPCLEAQPSFEDRRVSPALSSDAVDDECVREYRDVGSPQPGHGRDHTNVAQVAAKRDDPAVLGTATRPDPGGRRILAGDMTPDPRLPFGQECGSVPLAACLIAPGRWDRHDHASIRVDDDAGRARPRRSAQGVRQCPARKIGDRGTLVDDHRPMLARDPIVRSAGARPSPRPDRPPRTRSGSGVDAQ